MTVRLVTDSTADLPPEWIESFGITVVDLHLLEEDGRVLGTSSATPDELSEIYRDLLADPDCTGIVSVHLSQRLSRTWESAAEAAGRFSGRVLVVDSMGAGMLIGAAVAQCAWQASRGLGLSATYDLANRLTRNACVFVSVETLEPLRRGGRLGATIAVLGGALSMKPVLELRGGTLAVAAKTRTLTKAHNRMRELIREALAEGDHVVVVHHSSAAERAETIATEIRKETANPERIFVVEIDPVLAWHLGRGTVAVTVSPLDDAEFPIPGVVPQVGDAEA